MRKYFYSQNDLELLRFLKSTIPNKIWWNYIQYIFDYRDFYIKIEADSLPELPDNNEKYARVTIASLKKVDEKYDPSEVALLLCENQKILEVYIVRTQVFFSELKKPKKAETSAIKGFLNSLSGHKTSKFDQFINNIEGIYSDTNIHPTSALPANTSPRLVSLIDVGILIKINNVYIKSFIQNNSDDFMEFDSKYLYDNFDFEKMSKLYEFIKLE
jgi:hypothetical protein